MNHKYTVQPIEACELEPGDTILGNDWPERVDRVELVGRGELLRVWSVILDGKEEETPEDWDICDIRENFWLVVE